jgi:hypothetical protein
MSGCIYYHNTNSALVEGYYFDTFAFVLGEWWVFGWWAAVRSYPAEATGLVTQLP